MPIDIAGNKINKNAVKIHSHDGIVKRGLVCHIDSTDLNEKSDTVGDLSGNNNNGTTYTGTCLRFDGSNDYVESTSSILRTLEGVTKYSVSMWINQDVNNVYEPFWGIYNTHEIHTYSSGNYQFWHNGGGNNAVGGTTSADTWNFITVTFNAGTKKLYQNGDLKGTLTHSTTTSPTAGSSNMAVGSLGTGGGNFDGRISDLKVWNEVLTDGEIMELYKTPNLIVPSGRSTDALELWWPLSEGYGTTAYDASGHGHHGTLTNGPTWEGGQTDIPQQLGKGHSEKMVFDGDNDYINLGDSSGDFSTTTTTISCWVRTTSGSAGSIINDESAAGYAGLFLIYMESSGKILWRRGNSSNAEWGFISTNTINDGGWHNIVCIDNGSVLSMYIDGAAETASSNPGTYSTAAASGRNVAIGVLTRDYTTANFTGFIDEVAIWNTVLTASDIKALSATSTKTVLERSHIHGHSGAWVDYGAPLPPDARQIASNNLVGYWRNEGNAIWQDLSRSGNDGTINGSPNTLVFPEGHIEGRDSNGFPSKVNCLAFYGSDRGDYVSISGFGSLSTRTVDFWYKFTGGIITGGGDNVLFSDGSGWQGLDIVDDNNGSTAQLRWHNAAGSNPGALRTTGLKVNTWYHAAFAADGTGWELYHNGVSQGTNSITSTQASSVRLGTRTDGTYPYSGLVSAFKMYDRRLSADEIKHNYRVDSERFNVQNH